MFRKFALSILILLFINLNSYAEEPNKRQLFIFSATWCSPCQLVKKHVLTDTEVKKVIRDNYDKYKVDIDKIDSSVRNDWGVNSVPMLIITKQLNSGKFEILDRWQPRYIKEGSPNTYKREIQSFLRFLRKNIPKKVDN